MSALSFACRAVTVKPYSPETLTRTPTIGALAMLAQHQWRIAAVTPFNSGFMVFRVPGLTMIFAETGKLPKV
jgi:hypothetical protein